MTQQIMNSTLFTGSSGPLAVDFETYFATDYSVTDLGYYAYTHDRRFNAYLVAIFDGASSWVGHPRDFDWTQIAGRVWLAHNAEFDYHVWARLVEKNQIAGAPPSAWFCSAAAAAYLQLPRSLKGAVRSVFNVELDKSQRAAQKGRAAQPELFDNTELNDYAADDARWCWRLWEAIGPYWPEHERRIYQLTCEACRRGLPLDQAYLAESENVLKNAIIVAQQYIPWRPVGSILQLKAYCYQTGVPAPCSTAAASGEYQDWLKRHGLTAAGRAAQAVGDIRSYNRTLKVLQAMKRRLRLDGYMAYQLKYFGGCTGRWSGDNGLNVQNFNRGAVHGVSLRRVIACPPGKVFGILDFAQIEARVLLWIVGDQKTLDIIRGGVDLYEAHARATMNYTDPRPMKVGDPRGRQLAKARVLGLGYGCGATKFVEVARVMAGLEISFKDSQRIVNEYRASNPLITELWDHLEEQYKACHGGNYNMPLPSGRCIVYRGVNAETGDCTVGGDRENYYGGKLCENLVQAASRDLLASAWLRCDGAGYRPLVSIHDELVFELDEATARDDLKRLEAIMSQAPAWAAGCPIEAEGKLSAEYCK